MANRRLADSGEPIAGCRIGPFARSLPHSMSAQPNKQRAAGCVAHVSDDPVAADASTIGEIMAADKFGLLGKTAVQIRCLD